MAGFALALSVLLHAQDPAQLNETEQLREQVEAAEALVEESKLPEAREAVLAAWSVAERLTKGVQMTDEVMGLLQRLGGVAYRAGDLRTAHEASTEVHEHCLRTLPEDHRDLQVARQNLAATKNALGDHRGALALQEKFVEVLAGALPDDHPYLQEARLGVAGIRYSLGDIHGAFLLSEKVVEIMTRTLPEEHRDLQAARVLLALTKKTRGDLRGALALFERVAEVLFRTLPDDHEDVQTARLNLAITKRELGDLMAALVLSEKVVEVLSRTLPDDHPNLQRARGELASTKYRLGDLTGALALEEKVVEVFSRTLPDDHLDLQRARANLSGTKKQLGDFEGALVIEQRILDVFSRALPDDHPELQRARNNLAVTKLRLGDVEGALALAQAVLSKRSLTLSDDHPELQTARLNMALALKRHGNLEGALALEEKAFEVCSRTLPDDHEDLQLCRRNLVWSNAVLGNREAVLQLARQWSQACRRGLSTWPLSPREMGEMARASEPCLSTLGSLARGCGLVPPIPDVLEPLLLLQESARGVEMRTARLRHVGETDRARAEALQAALFRAAEKLVAVDHADRRRAAAREKDLLQRELFELARRVRGFDGTAVTTEALAACLPERTAAVSVISYTHWSAVPEKPHEFEGERRLLGLCLPREGRLLAVPLGRIEEVEDLVAEIRSGVGAGDALARNPEVGRRPRFRREGTPRAAAKLRRLVIDPILDALTEAEVLYVSLDESLQLVPLDALPDEKGKVTGERVEIRTIVSLFDLVERTEWASDEAEPSLLTLGGIRYDQIEEQEPPGAPEAARYRFLPGTEKEVRKIASLFAETHPGGKTSVATGLKTELFERAKGARYVHMATHGYFAPERVSHADRWGQDSAFGSRGGHRGATGLSPLVLCGLALSGANLPPDQCGRRHGIVTAEELLQLDLTQCELITLSACDTSLGVRRAGQGYASLRTALQGAGARYVLTSLWEVGDDATHDLMIDFYRRMWVLREDPHAALWKARMAARKRGAAFRDWAGWALTGR